MDKINIGLIGLGTVGSGVVKTLAGFENIHISKIAVRDVTKKRNIEGLDENILTDDPFSVVNDENIQIVVEVMGGVNPAYELIKTALENGKHIVTANKEILAKHGKELFTLAEKHNRVILYEAAIAGGIPLIMPIKTILAGNKINKINAILNGTTNYILTKMDTDGVSYEEVLEEAQKLGYAETNPTGDVEGFDAAYKITTLATIAFGKRVKYENVYREGITKIRKEDMAKANELGYKIKLIASAKIDENNRADVRVHPMLVLKKASLAHINYVTNAVEITGEPVGTVVLSGAGAGEFPTASSVVGDILAINSEIDKDSSILPMMHCRHDSDAIPVSIDDTFNKYYISITAPNAIGVIAMIGTICANKNISLSSILQKEVFENKTADITVITERCQEKLIKEVVGELKDCTVNSIIRVAD